MNLKEKYLRNFIAESVLLEAGDDWFKRYKDYSYETGKDDTPGQFLKGAARKGWTSIKQFFRGSKIDMEDFHEMMGEEDIKGAYKELCGTTWTIVAKGLQGREFDLPIKEYLEDLRMPQVLDDFINHMYNNEEFINFVENRPNYKAWVEHVDTDDKSEMVNSYITLMITDTIKNKVKSMFHQWFDDRNTKINDDNKKASEKAEADRKKAKDDEERARFMKFAAPYIAKHGEKEGMRYAQEALNDMRKMNSLSYKQDKEMEERKLAAQAARARQEDEDKARRESDHAGKVAKMDRLERENDALLSKGAIESWQHRENAQDIRNGQTWLSHTRKEYRQP